MESPISLLLANGRQGHPVCVVVDYVRRSVGVRVSISSVTLSGGEACKDPIDRRFCPFGVPSGDAAIRRLAHGFLGSAGRFLSCRYFGTEWFLYAFLGNITKRGGVITVDEGDASIWSVPRLSPYCLPRVQSFYSLPVFFF